MKIRAVDFFHCAGVAQTVTIGTLLLSGCSSTEILKPRTGVPPPITAPPAPPELVHIPVSRPIPTEVGRPLARKPVSEVPELIVSEPGKGVAVVPPPADATPIYEKSVPILEIIDMEPASKGGSKVSATTSLPMPRQVESKPLTHTVARGESLWVVARMYGVSTGELASANNLDAKASVKAGMELTLPPGAKFVPSEERPPIKVNSPKSKAAKASSKTTEVSPALSKSKTERITVPDRVASPKTETVSLPKTERPLASRTETVSVSKTEHSSAVKSERAAASGEYVVKSGDNLWIIAKKFDVHGADIAKLNNLDSSKPLNINQTIRIPQGGSGGVQSAAASSGAATVHASKTEKSVQGSKTEKPAVSTPVKSKSDKPGAVSDTAKKSNGDNAGAGASKASPPSAAPVGEKKDSLIEELEKMGSDDGDDAAEGAQPPVAESDMLTHAVKDGDTWDSISMTYGVKVDDLKKNNPNGLKPGSTVKFPK